MVEKREPCEYHIQFVQDIATIKETLFNINTIISNHWSEIKSAVEKYSGIDKKVSEHTLLLEAIAKETLNTTKNSQWRIALIASAVCSIPAFITAIILLIKFTGGK